MERWIEKNWSPCIKEGAEQNTNVSSVKQLPLPTITDIESAVHVILSEQHSRGSSFSLPSFKPNEDLIEHTDSLGFINMVLELEKKFAVTIKDWKAVTRLDKLVQEVIKERNAYIGKQIKVNHNISEDIDDAPKVQRGLQSVILDYSSISSINGKDGLLAYCGTPVDKLVNRRYIDIAFKIFHGRYPTNNERIFALKQFRLGQKREGQTAELIDKICMECPSPIKFILSVVPLFQKQSPRRNASQWSFGLQLQGFVAAAICRHATLVRGDNAFQSTIKQSLPVWVLEELSGHSLSDTEKKATESLFVMLAECVTNPGTFAARITTSTDADYVSAVVAALAVFSGTKHGGATDDVVTMIKDIGTPSNVVDWVKTAQHEKRPIPGFGHRVFQVTDPRAQLLANWIEMLIKEGADDISMKIITEVINIMVPMRRHGIYVNVDAYTGVLLTMLGVPRGYGTLVFALARMAGWNAHVQEQKINNIMISPLISYRPRKM